LGWWRRREGWRPGAAQAMGPMSQMSSSHSKDLLLVVAPTLYPLPPPVTQLSLLDRRCRPPPSNLRKLPPAGFLLISCSSPLKMLILRLVLLATLAATLLSSARGDATCNTTSCTTEKQSGGVPLELLAVIPGFGLMHGFAMMYCSKKRGDEHFKKWLFIGLIANVFGAAPPSLPSVLFSPYNPNEQI